MKVFRMEETGHTFEKTNIITMADDKGQFDIYKCKVCGLSGKRRRLDNNLQFDGRLSDGKIIWCSEEIKPTKIKINGFHGSSPNFKNATEGSIHEVVPTPEGQKDDRGVWIMGIHEPFLVLRDEYKVI